MTKYVQNVSNFFFPIVNTGTQNSFSIICGLRHLQLASQKQFVNRYVLYIDIEHNFRLTLMAHLMFIVKIKDKQRSINAYKSNSNKY